MLVVDDDTDTTELFARVLDDRDYVVEIANDGFTAIARAEAFVPQIVLLDLGLPLIDGYEVARQLRHDLPDVRVVAVTAYGQASDRERSRAEGFAAHLVKPVSIRDLLETLKDVRGTLPDPRLDTELSELELAAAEDLAPTLVIRRTDRAPRPGHR